MSGGGETGPFAVGEKVLVPHTDKYYEAKVLRAQLREDGLWYYGLHYTGWNKKWDEWVEETGLQKCAQGPGPTPAAGKKGGSKGGPGGKRSRGALGEPGAGGCPGEAGAPPEAQLSLSIPAPLKKQLLDDHDAVVEDAKLLPLPRRPTVSDITQQYVAHVAARQASADGEDDVAAGLRLYFDKALQHCLLYRGERAQAEQALAGGRVPSSMYGAEHFLRLFVKLPELLPVAGLPEEAAALLTARLEDVLRFMQLKQGQLFLGKDGYMAAPPPAAPADAGS